MQTTRVGTDYQARLQHCVIGVLVSVPFDPASNPELEVRRALPIAGQWYRKPIQLPTPEMIGAIDDNARDLVTRSRFCRSGWRGGRVGFVALKGLTSREQITALR